MKYERKFYVIDMSETAEYQKEFDSLEEANWEAEIEWGYLTDHDKKQRRIYVAVDNDDDVDYAIENMGALDDEGNVDYSAVWPSDIPDGAFDSDLIPEEDDDEDEDE